jgi:hypothetical protein
MLGIISNQLHFLTILVIIANLFHINLPEMEVTVNKPIKMGGK